MPFFVPLIYLPLYNLLAFFVDVIPGSDLGLAVIAITLVVRFIFLPISLSALKTQRAMRDIQPQLTELREKYRADPQELARRTLALYKENKVRPFSSMLLMLLQLPIIVGVYGVSRDAAHYHIDPNLLYSFVPYPEHLSALFLGTFSVASSSLSLAVLAGITQFAYAYRAVPLPPKKSSAEASMQDEFGRAMALQMRYLFPFVIGSLAFTSGAVALYLIAGNIFMFAQDLWVRRAKPQAAGLTT